LSSSICAIQANHEVTVDIPETALRGAEFETIRRLFHQTHNRLYGYDLGEERTNVELVNIRLTAIGLVPQPALAIEPQAGAEPATALKGKRAIHLAERGGFIEVPVFDGDRLRHGNSLKGPAVIESVNTTIVVPGDFALAVDAAGTCVLSAL
jgi:N-methylhydantoinase A